MANTINARQQCIGRLHHNRRVRASTHTPSHDVLIGRHPPQTHTHTHTRTHARIRLRTWTCTRTHKRACCSHIRVCARVLSCRMWYIHRSWSRGLGAACSCLQNGLHDLNGRPLDKALLVAVRLPLSPPLSQHQWRGCSRTTRSASPCPTHLRRGGEGVWRWSQLPPSIPCDTSDPFVTPTALPARCCTGRALRAPSPVPEAKPVCLSTPHRPQPQAAGAYTPSPTFARTTPL